MSANRPQASTKRTANHREKPAPSYRRHRQSGQAITTLVDGAGNRKDVLLGKYGTRQSRVEYAKVIGQWEEAGRQIPGRRRSSDMTVTEVIDAYWQHIETYYRMPDGSPSSEVNNVRLALRPLKALHGPTPAADFDALGLEAIREKMIRDGHCRSRVNKDVARIKRMFRWAGSKKLVPGSVYQDLNTLEGLRAGRSHARETAPVLPVPRAIVDQTLAVMRPTLADMVRLQLETGMRPGELCIMRGIDIDMTSNPAAWLYRPMIHKTAHHGHSRIVPIGPRAQEIVRRHLKPNVEAYLFSPRESVAEFRARSNEME
jgi:integrase